jgi:death on curing protein
MEGLRESAIFRPQTGYYNDLFEEAAAVMESSGNNHAFIDGNKCLCFVMTDAMLRANRCLLSVDALVAYEFITGAMERKEFRFPGIREWIMSIAKPLAE